jgi:hypothetical protein
VQVGKAERLFLLGCRGSAQQGAKSGHQLCWGKGLDQVVVGATLQPLDAVLDGIARGEHQDRRLVAGIPQARQHPHAVQLWHHPVEHDGLGPLGLNLGQRLLSIASRNNAEPLIAQGPAQHIQKFMVVVGNEYGDHRRLFPVLSPHYYTVVPQLCRAFLCA